METVPSTNSRRSSAVQTENFRRNDFPIFYLAYIAGRIIMIGITIYFLINEVSDELICHYDWLGFLTAHMIMECSVTYSDPLWNSKLYIREAKIQMHWTFAVAALISGTVYFCFRKITFPEIANYNSTGNTTIPNEIVVRESWHCARSYRMLSSLLALAFIAVFVTGIILSAGTRPWNMYIYRFHKCSGTVITYSMIILLSCNIFGWISAPINWIIFFLTIIAFVLMPVKIFANRSVID